MKAPFPETEETEAQRVRTGSQSESFTSRTNFPWCSGDRPWANFWDRANQTAASWRGSQSGGGGSHTQIATPQRGREKGKKQNQGRLKGEWGI